SPSGLLGRFVRRIDRLKAELIGAEPFAAWAAEQSEAEREFAEVYRTHERMLAAAGARDGGDLVRDALGKLERGPADRFEHVLVDDAQELDFAAASLVRSAGGANPFVAGDPHHALRRLRGAGRARLESFTDLEGARTIELERSRRCAARIMQAARVVLGEESSPDGAAAAGEVEFWRCANGRAEAQAVAAEVERLL